MLRLAMFAKHWQPGEVKTRLVPALGERGAARLYRQFVLCLLERFARFGDERVLVYAPADRPEPFRDLLPADWRMMPQAEGDLGARMRHLFEWFGNSARTPDDRLLLIGSDSPTLPAELPDRAAEQLRRVPVVLGPSDDGGYYLIGLRADAVQPPLLDALFREMPWSEPRLRAETVGRLERAGCPWAELPAWYDVDEAESWNRLRAELQVLCSDNQSRSAADLRGLTRLGRVVSALTKD